MKILIQFLGVKESGPIFTYELTRGLVENKFDVYAILCDEIENKEKWLKLLGEKRIYFFNHWLSKKSIIKSCFGFIVEFNKLNKFFNGIYFDYSIRTFVCKYDDILVRAVKVRKVINFCHDPIPHSGVNKKDAKKNKELVDRSDKIVVLTKKFIPLVEKEYSRNRKEIIFVPHGLLSYSDGKMVEDKRYNAKERIKFLFFGRIDPYKGIDVLVDAYMNLEIDHPDIELIIAGSGDMTEVSEKVMRLKNKKVINRYIYSHEVDDIFKEDNIILVLPYKDATQSGVATLAFEYGVPVIASDTGGLKEQMFDGKVGILVKANDVKGLMHAMERFLIEDGLYDREVSMMCRCRKELSWDKIAKRLIEESFD